MEFFLIRNYVYSFMLIVLFLCILHLLLLLLCR